MYIVHTAFLVCVAFVVYMIEWNVVYVVRSVYVVRKCILCI